MSKDTVKERFNVAGLLLAAGMSRRSGDLNKLLYLHAGKSLVQHVAQTLTESCINNVLVVLGHDARAVETAIEQYPVSVSVNRDYAQGLASSLVHGVSLLFEADAVVVCLADMPHVSSNVINQLVSAMIDNADKSIFIPTYQARRGNPVLITKARFEDILNLSGDEGARVLAKQQPDEVLEVETGNQSVLLDYDTVDDLDKLKGLQSDMALLQMIPMP